MARKRPQHARDFSEPMQWQDMTGQQQKAAKGIVTDFGSNFGERAHKQATALERQAAQPGVKDSNAKLYAGKAKRLRKAAEVAPTGPVTLNSAADNRVAHVEAAATRNRMETPVGHPAAGRTATESIAGAGWYFHANSDVAAHAPNLPEHERIVGSSMMSPGTDPQTERRALGALDHAHTQGVVHMGPRLVQHLSAKGVAVPAEHHNRVVSFSALPGHVVGQLAQLDTQEIAHEHSNGINFSAMGAVSSTLNVAKAHDVLRGATPVDQAQSPVDAPKTWSYTDDQRKARPNTGIHHEYMARASHLGAAIRGEQASNTPVSFQADPHAGLPRHAPQGGAEGPSSAPRPGDTGRVHMRATQDQLDLWGHQDSNEGILSNRQHTAEDNWMRGISIGLRDPGLLKAGGDVQPGVKVHPEHGPASPPGVGGEAVYHAWNNRSTQLAADKLQRKYDTKATVPTVLVQETSWTSARRDAGQSGGKGDQDFNAHVRGIRQAEKDAHRENRPVSQQLQPYLPMKVDKSRDAGLDEARRKNGNGQMGLF